MKTYKHQQEGLEAYMKTLGGILFAIGTGGGKTKLAIDCVNQHSKDTKVLVVVPFLTLINDWKIEIKKWNKHIKFDFVTYVSLPKCKHYSFVILDEAHHITERSFEYFTNNKCEVIALSATVPEEKDKKEMIRALCPNKFTYQINKAISDNVATDFRVIQYMISLSSEKNIQRKGKMMSEKQVYHIYDMAYKRACYSQNEMLMKIQAGNRARFIYNLASKTNAAKSILKDIIGTERCLIFAGSIAQAEELCKNTYHSKTTDEALKKFNSKRLNKLACVDALDEGKNIKDLNCGLIVQCKSKVRRLIQRIGRFLRGTENSTIHLITVKGTQDEKWCQNALAGIPKDKITTIDL